MKTKLNKLFSGLSKTKKLHVDTFTENLINTVPGQKIANSADGDFFIDIQELGGYFMLDVMVISTENLSTRKECKLSFINPKNTLELIADDEKVKSEFSNVSNRYLTKMSYHIEKSFITSLKTNKFKTVKINSKKTELSFNLIKF